MGPSLEGARVVITGAAGVYGRELAVGFAEAGATLCLSDFRDEALGSLARSLEIPPERLVVHATDLTQTDSIQEFSRVVRDAWGSPDVLVNNAGIYPFGGLLDMEVDLWDRIMDTNLRAPFLLTQAFARAMVEEGVKGSIINVSSGAADILRTNGVPYCVSKRGLEWLSRGFALDLAKYGIRVNCVRPGFAVGSALTEFPQGYAETMGAANPMGRLARPGEFTDAVLFLASHQAAYITGECLAVDGGSSIPRRSGRATEADRHD